jgi:serine/threonine protein kinase
VASQATATHVNGYAIVAPLGAGGQGRVFKVADPRIPGKFWALKLLRDPLLFEAEKRALQALSTLHHPAIPRLANAFAWSQEHALVLTFFPGRSALGQRREWPWVLETLHAVGDALERIHGQDYLYLDLKPGNLILGDDGRRYLIDYSIAQPRPAATATGVGTTGFAAPEQLRVSGALDAAADAFALGALGQYLLTGAPPVPGVPASLPSIPFGFERLLHELTAVDPRQRAPIDRLLGYPLDAAHGEMRRCPTCGRGLRRQVEICPGCRSRLAPAALAVPDLRGQPRSLPRTVIRRTTAVTNEVLNELAKPSRPRFPFYRELRLMAERIAQVRGFDRLQAPPRLRHLITFYPHQLDAAKRALQDMRGNAILADEVGLGKTIEAGLIVKELALRKLANRILVLTPPHLVDQWTAEMREKFALSFKAYEGPPDWGQPMLVASTYAFGRDANFRRIERLPEPYDLLIVDEMHNLLKVSGEPNQAYEFLRRTARSYTLLLSATPIRHHLRELYHLVNLISPGSFANDEAGFLRRFERFGQRADLRTELERVMIRHHRANLPADALPPPREIVARPVPITPDEQRLADRAVAVARSRGRGASPDLLAAAFGSAAAQCALLGERPETVHCSKSAVLVELLRRIQDQVIVFTRDRATGDDLERRLQQAGFPVVYFRAGLTRQEKTQRFYRFKHDPRAILVATDIAAEGRNLQFASHLVNFDVPWNPLKLEQRMGRIDRLGQRRTPRIHNLYYERGFEGAVYHLFERGLRMFDLIIGELASVLGEIEEFDNRPLDRIVADLWIQHAQHPARLQTAMSELATKLQDARTEFDSGKRLSEQLDQELF